MASNRDVRVFEKQTLSNLNDRLAALIDRSRRLQSENDNLRMILNEREATGNEKRECLNKLYEEKVDNLNGLLQKAVGERDFVQTECAAEKSECEHYRVKVGELSKDILKSQDDRSRCEVISENLRIREKLIDEHCSRVKEENKSFKVQNAETRKMIATLGNQLDNVVAENADLQNTNGALKEEYQHLSSKHEMEVEEERKKRRQEIEKTVSEVEFTYESRLREQLQTMRDEFDARHRKNRDQLEKSYKVRLDEVKAQRSETERANEECVLLRLRLQKLESNAVNQCAYIDQLETQSKQSEDKLTTSRKETEDVLHQRDETIEELQQKSDQLQKDRQDLMMLKTQMSTELGAYNELLHSEESRLNIAMPHTPCRDDTSYASQDQSNENLFDEPHIGNSHRGIKRKQHLEDVNNTYDFNEMRGVSKCDVEIDGTGKNGEFIKLISHSSDVVPIGGWTVKSVSGGKETMYKFHQRQTISIQQSVTIWSAGTERKPNPPSVFVMKSERWPCDGLVSTTLFNAGGIQVAIRQTDENSAS